MEWYGKEKIIKGDNDEEYEVDDSDEDREKQESVMVDEIVTTLKPFFELIQQQSYHTGIPFEINETRDCHAEQKYFVSLVNDGNGHADYNAPWKMNGNLNGGWLNWIFLKVPNI